MRKNFLIPVLSFFCANQVLGEQVKKLTDKEFVIKKNRNESLQDIQKPKNLIVNSDAQKFSPYDFSLDDLTFDIKALPMNLDLIAKEKKVQKLRNNLIRIGAGGKLFGISSGFVHVADMFLKKKKGNCSGHLIVRSKTPYFWNGWKENSQFFIDYTVTDYCKPFFVFNQGWKDFYVQIDKSKKESSNFDLDFKVACPILFDKSEFKPSLSFRHSNFSSEKEKDFKENEVNLNFDFAFAAVDNINFSCDTKIKNLYYDEKTMIYDYYVKNGLNPNTDVNKVILQELGDDNDVTFFKATPKIGFTFNQIEFTPKLCFDYCSNKKFVKSDQTNFALGIDIGYVLENKANLKFFYSGGLKPNTFHKIFKKHPWTNPQAVMATNNKWEIGVKANTQVSNFKFNVGLQANSYNFFPIHNGAFSNIKSVLIFDDVRRYRGTIGTLYESDLFDTLLSASIYNFQLPVGSQTFYKVKCDIAFSVVDRILMHLRGVISHKNGNYFEVGVDYVYSDLLTFFVNCGDCGGLRIVFGTSITPDKWIEKDFNHQLV